MRMCCKSKYFCISGQLWGHDGTKQRTGSAAEWSDMQRLEALGVIFAHVGWYPLLNLCNQPRSLSIWKELDFRWPNQFQGFQIFGEKLQVTIRWVECLSQNFLVRGPHWVVLGDVKYVLFVLKVNRFMELRRILCSLSGFSYVFLREEIKALIGRIIIKIPMICT